jgi:hypothetical protein
LATEVVLPANQKFDRGKVGRYNPGLQIKQERWYRAAAWNIHKNQAGEDQRLKGVWSFFMSDLGKLGRVDRHEGVW